MSGPAHIYPTPEMRPGAALSRRSFAEGMAKYVEGRADGFGPKSQMQALETEGIDIAALYPSSTILSFPTPKTDGLDPKLSAAICRGYNDWLTDFCSIDSARLKGVAATPIHDVEESVIEINRAVKENSMIAAYIRPNVINGRNLHDAYYDPLYSTLEDLNIPLVVHEGDGGRAAGGRPAFPGQLGDDAHGRSSAGADACQRKHSGGRGAGEAPEAERCVPGVRVQLAGLLAVEAGRGAGGVGLARGAVAEEEA